MMTFEEIMRETLTRELDQADIDVAPGAVDQMVEQAMQEMVDLFLEHNPAFREAVKYSVRKTAGKVRDYQ